MTNREQIDALRPPTKLFSDEILDWLVGELERNGMRDAEIRAWSQFLITLTWRAEGIIVNLDVQVLNRIGRWQEIHESEDMLDSESMLDLRCPDDWAWAARQLRGVQ